jgi:deoxyuridine 5'-triphosphate nucleotidohydrolase
MGSRISTTLKESVVWGEREVDATDPIGQGQDDDQCTEHACAIPIELAKDKETEYIAPIRATERAAGFDIRASKSLTLPPATKLGGMGTVVPTGVMMALDVEEIHGRISPDTVLYGDLRGRSSLAKKGIRVFQGTIDADYRGEIGVLMFNDTNEDFKINAGDRIAQLIIQIALVPVFAEVEDIQKTYASQRGCGGFGSTGVGDVVESKIVVEGDGSGSV